MKAKLARLCIGDVGTLALETLRVSQDAHVRQNVSHAIVVTNDELDLEDGLPTVSGSNDANDTIDLLDQVNG